MYGEQKQGILPFVLNHMKRNLDKVKLETKHVSAILLVIKVKVLSQASILLPNAVAINKGQATTYTESIFKNTFLFCFFFTLFSQH